MISAQPQPSVIGYLEKCLKLRSWVFSQMRSMFNFNEVFFSFFVPFSVEDAGRQADSHQLELELESSCTAAPPHG